MDHSETDEALFSERFRAARDQGIERLYHFQRYDDDHLRQLAATGRVKFAEPAKINDPWDGKPEFTRAALDDPKLYTRHVDYMETLGREISRLPEEELARRSARLRQDRAFMEAQIAENTVEMGRAIDRHYRIYCLSTSNDHPLMWGHYADSHRGLCIEFNTADDVIGDAYQVHYEREVPAVDLSATGTEAEAHLVIASLLTKSTDWSYEDEYRLVARENESMGFLVTHESFFRVDRRAITAIYFGCMMTDENASRAARSIRDYLPALPILRARKVTGRYALAFEAID